ncbi:Nucleotide-diphospho-sugar transferase [Sesbania bispinosa]|nr:Nucleotide-diphospho-sugar transferase [Sesbania bispinosa]
MSEGHGNHFRSPEEEDLVQRSTKKIKEKAAETMDVELNGSFGDQGTKKIMENKYDGMTVELNGNDNAQGPLLESQPKVSYRDKVMEIDQDFDQEPAEIVRMVTEELFPDLDLSRFNDFGMREFNLNPTVNLDKGKDTDVSSAKGILENNSKEEDPVFGPWMLVRKSPKKKSKNSPQIIPISTIINQESELTIPKNSSSRFEVLASTAKELLESGTTKVKSTQNVKNTKQNHTGPNNTKTVVPRNMKSQPGIQKNQHANQKESTTGMSDKLKKSNKGVVTVESDVQSVKSSMEPDPMTTKDKEKRDDWEREVLAMMSRFHNKRWEAHSKGEYVGDLWSMDKGNWNLDLITDFLPPEIIDRLHVVVPPREELDDDTPSWSDTADREFSMKEMYGKIGAASNSGIDQDLWKYIWNWKDQDDIPAVTSKQVSKWREWQALQDLKSHFSKEVLDVIVSSTNDMGPLSLENFRKNNLSASWRIGLKNSNTTYQLNKPATQVKQEQQKGKEGRSSVGIGQWTDSPTRLARRQLIEKRKEKRATELVKQDDEVIVKLEDSAIERSKSVDSAVLGKYNIWRKENENENPDSTVRLMRDQIIMARVYLGIAKMKNKLQLYQELQSQLKESQRALGDATSDADLRRSDHEKIKAMGQVLSKAKEQLYDCKLVTGKLRAMLQTADEQITTLLPPEKRKFPRSENLENPSLYHYALFSDNVLAASVVVNSTLVNAKDPSKHVFHLVTDKLNFGAMNMWFLLNPPGKATINVENVDEFKWLNSSYCPVLRQLESATMKEYYFKAGHPTNSGASNLKYRNPKYLSMLNHLRFYLPQVYPKLDKILFLDDDIVVQKDLTGLWAVNLQGKVNGAVETCGESFHRFDKYLNFSNPHIAKNFDPNACGWAYGMNMFDLKVWKKKDITGIYHKWQNLNEDRVLWKLGTLPPGLMTFYGLTHPLNKSWHVLGLGYNPSVDRSEIENAAVVHYNGNMKPWLEIAMTKYRSYWTKYVKYNHPYLRNCKLNE